MIYSYMLWKMQVVMFVICLCMIIDIRMISPLSFCNHVYSFWFPTLFELKISNVLKLVKCILLEQLQSWHIKFICGQLLRLHSTALCQLNSLVFLLSRNKRKLHFNGLWKQDDITLMISSDSTPGVHTFVIWLVPYIKPAIILLLAAFASRVYNRICAAAPGLSCLAMLHFS